MGSKNVNVQPNIYVYHEGHEEHEVEIIMFISSPFMFFMIIMVNLKFLRLHKKLQTISGETK
jgi:hypothetical protein